MKHNDAECKTLAFHVFHDCSCSSSSLSREVDRFVIAGQVLSVIISTIPAMGLPLHCVGSVVPMRPLPWCGVFGELSMSFSGLWSGVGEHFLGFCLGINPYLDTPGAKLAL